MTLSHLLIEVVFNCLFINDFRDYNLLILFDKKFRICMLSSKDIVRCKNILVYSPLGIPDLHRNYIYIHPRNLKSQSR